MYKAAREQTAPMRYFKDFLSRDNPSGGNSALNRRDGKNKST